MNTERVRRDFDALARLGDGYDSGSPRYEAFLLASVPAHATRVLDIGCGLGKLTCKLARAGRDIVAVDLSPEMIARARARLREADNVAFICGDFLELDFGTTRFDCMISSAALHHMPADAALYRMRDLLQPGGRLIVHDVRAGAGFLDQAKGAVVLGYEAARRLLKTGWPVSPRHVRHAWQRHGAGETYLTWDEARALFDRCMPGSRLYSHWGWRYTAIWDRPAS